MTTKIPEKIDRLPYDIAKLYSTAVLGEYYKRDATINQLKDVLHELTSCIDTIEGNQFGMKRGNQPTEQEVERDIFGQWSKVPVDQPKRHRIPDIMFALVSASSWDGKVDQNKFFELISPIVALIEHEAAEAYKAKLLSDNQQ